MRDALVLFGVVLLVWVLGVVIVTALAHRTLRRANQVAPGTPSPAPVRWLWSPMAPARLHRRLQAVAWQVGTHPDLTLAAATATGDLREALVGEAVRLDVELARVHRAPTPARRRALRSIGSQVRALEELAERLCDLGGRAPAPRPVPPPLAPLAERIDHLAAGRREIAGVDPT